jgi:hypothetical protein
MTVFKSASFWIGTIASILIWGAIFTLDYRQKFDGLCMDCDNDFGFPFKVYQSGGLVHATEILWFGITVNFFVVAISSVLVGYLVFLFLGKRRFN